MNRDFKGVWIDKKIWIDKKLTWMEKLLFVEINSLDNDKNGCYATNKYFSDFFNLSKTRISEIIKSLSDKKYIKIHNIKKDNTNKRYLKVIYTNYSEYRSRFRNTEGDIRNTEGGVRNTEGGVRNTEGGVNNKLIDTNGSQEFLESNNTFNNTSNIISNNIKENFGFKDPLLLDEEINSNKKVFEDIVVSHYNKNLELTPNQISKKMRLKSESIKSGIESLSKISKKFCYTPEQLKEMLEFSLKDNFWKDHTINLDYPNLTKKWGNGIKIDCLYNSFINNKNKPNKSNKPKPHFDEQIEYETEYSIGEL